MYENGEFFLLPEIQFDYAILDFDDIKISKKVKKLIEKDEYLFKVNEEFDEVCQRIKNYHENSWFCDNYIEILKSIKRANEKNNNFDLISIELYQKSDKKLISGEIGYKINNIYTSLSGFTTKSKEFNNWGKLQMVLLNEYLKENSYKFWNLGHPQLQYKLDLGAKVYSRDKFLKRWFCNY